MPQPDAAVASLPTPFRLPQADLEADPHLRAWAESLRAEAAPGDALESALVDLLIAAAHRLAAVDRREPDFKPGDAAFLRLRADAQRAWSRALTDWQRARKAAAVLRTYEPEPEPAPPTPAAPPEPPAPVVLPEVEDWLAHVGIDPEVSRLWPVVKGTDVTVEQVACMLADGWRPEDVLRQFPALTPEQIAACKKADELFMCGPWRFGEPMANPPLDRPDAPTGDGPPPA